VIAFAQINKIEIKINALLLPYPIMVPIPNHPINAPAGRRPDITELNRS